MPRLIFITVTYIAACYADLLSISPEDFQQSNDIKIATIVHNTPSAVSHTTFTRVHNHHIGSGSTQHSQHASVAHLPIVSTTAPHTVTVHQTSAVPVQAPIYTTTQQLHTFPQTIARPIQPALQTVAHAATVTTATFTRDDTPIVKPLTHTPAHLTFAARPVIYQMLPEIKPVRKISFDEVVPSPRNKQNAQQP